MLEGGHIQGLHCTATFANEGSINTAPVQCLEEKAKETYPEALRKKVSCPGMHSITLRLLVGAALHQRSKENKNVFVSNCKMYLSQVAKAQYPTRLLVCAALQHQRPKENTLRQWCGVTVFAPKPF